MSKPLTKKDLPSFDAINKHNVAIQSLRNRLKAAKGIDELTNLAARIIELENKILTEKTVGYKKLEVEKKVIETRISKLSRELNKATLDLSRVDNSLDYKLNGYKQKLQTRIDSLNEEYIMIMGYISSSNNSPANSTLSSPAPTPSSSSRKLAYTVSMSKN